MTLTSLTRPFLLGPALFVALAWTTPETARADGWWETACNSDGHEGSGGCTNPDNPNGCTCETRSAGSHAASVGSTLAMFGVVAWRIGRRRRK